MKLVNPLTLFVQKFALIERKQGSKWRHLKWREPQLVTNCHGFILVAANGKKRIVDYTNTEGMLRIIQSMTFPKAKPFKQ